MIHTYTADEWLRDWRDAHGLTTSQMAEKVGYKLRLGRSRNFYALIKGNHQIKQFRIWLQFANAGVEIPKWCFPDGDLSTKIAEYHAARQVPDHAELEAPCKITWRAGSKCGSSNRCATAKFQPCPFFDPASVSSPMPGDGRTLYDEDAGVYSREFRG